VSSSGETDPGLVSLYPRSDNPAEHREILTRHARQLELSVIVDRQHYKEIKSLNATMIETNKLLKQQIDEAGMEKATRAIEAARRDHSLKRMTALLGFGGAIVGALGAAVAAYLTHGSDIPVIKPATAAQIRAYDEHERAAKHEPAPTPEFNAIIDSAK
jgi:hypothetical protein